MLLWLVEIKEHIPDFMQNCIKDSHISFEQSSVSTVNNEKPRRDSCLDPGRRTCALGQQCPNYSNTGLWGR